MPRKRSKPETPAVPDPAPEGSSFGYADMFDLDALQKKVSKAIGEHLGLMWDKQTEQVIREEVGEEGWAMVQEIDAFANRGDFWERAPNHDRAYQNIQSQLASKFPYLSPQAIQRLATRAAWSWR